MQLVGLDISRYGVIILPCDGDGLKSLPGNLG